MGPGVYHLHVTVIYSVGQLIFDQFSRIDVNWSSKFDLKTTLSYVRIRRFTGALEVLCLFLPINSGLTKFVVV